MPKYAAQAADATLALAERIASSPDVVAALEIAGASPTALVVAAGLAVGRALRESTHRTELLPSARRDVAGSVPVSRTMGRGTEADDYELLDGAPIGRPESLRAAQIESAARASDAAWELRNKLADAGLALTRKQRENARRARQRKQRRNQGEHP